MRDNLVILGILLILIGASIFVMGENPSLLRENKQIEIVPKIEIVGEPIVQVSNTPEYSKINIQFTLKNSSSVDGKAEIMIFLESNSSINEIINTPYYIPANSTLTFEYKTSTFGLGNEKIKISIIKQWRA
jgi:hypothetical protein